MNDQNDDNLPAKQGAVNFFGKRKQIRKTVAQLGKTTHPGADATGEMTNVRLNEILAADPAVSELLRRHAGHWTFRYSTVLTYIMTDDRKGIDRMRIMSKISDDPREIGRVSPHRLLKANCHEALDARFCYEDDDSLWAAFIHPLSTLTEQELRSGLKQVTHLAREYPRSLSSLDIVFRGTGPEDY